MTKRTLLSTTGAAILGLGLLTACGSDDSSSTPSSAAPTAASAAFATPGAQLVPLSTVEGEPTVQVPLPNGWQQTELPPEAAAATSYQIRLTLTAPALAEGGFTPNVIVVSSPSDADTQAVLDKEVQLATQGDPQATVTTGSTCGYPSATVELELPAEGAVPARPGIGKIIVVSHGTGSITYSLTAQTLDAENATYQQDVKTILDGIQITK